MLLIDALKSSEMPEDLVDTLKDVEPCQYKDVFLKLGYDSKKIDGLIKPLRRKMGVGGINCAQGIHSKDLFEKKIFDYLSLLTLEDYFSEIHRRRGNSSF